MHDSDNSFASTVQATVRDHARYLEDLGNVLLPGSRLPPTEEVVAACRQALTDIISQIEQSVMSAAGYTPSEKRHSQTFVALAESGSLHDPRLIDAVFQQCQLWRLIRREEDAFRPEGGCMAQSHFALLEQDFDPVIRETAQQLRQAEQRYSVQMRGYVEDLPLSVLHRLCWRIADLLDSGFDADPALRLQIPRAATLWLSERHEGENLLTIASKLAFLLNRHGDTTDQAWLLDPSMAGVPLFMAVVAMKARCEPSLFLDAMGDPAVGRLAILLHAAGINPLQAAAIFGHFGRGRFASGDIVQAIECYEAQKPQEIEAALTLWRESRRIQAEFPHMGTDKQ